MDEKTKSRNPWFRFYADDFFAGTADMSQAEVGAYIRLLCHQWNRGSIPVQPDKLQRLAGGIVTNEVMQKFKIVENDCRKNQRMEVERGKQDAFIAKQRGNGVKSGEARRRLVEPRFNSGSTKNEPRFNSGCDLVPTKHEPPITITIGKDICSSAMSDEFDKFWNSYPRRVGKKTAKASWSKLKPEDKADAMGKLPAFLSSEDWTKDGGQFVPHPATWLNGRRWEDEIAPQSPKAQANGKPLTAEQRWGQKMLAQIEAEAAK